jgi:hypothetical protein
MSAVLIPAVVCALRAEATSGANQAVGEEKGGGGADRRPGNTPPAREGQQTPQGGGDPQKRQKPQAGVTTLEVS